MTVAISHRLFFSKSFSERVNRSTSHLFWSSGNFGCMIQGGFQRFKKNFKKNSSKQILIFFFRPAFYQLGSRKVELHSVGPDTWSIVSFDKTVRLDFLKKLKASVVWQLTDTINVVFLAWRFWCIISCQLFPEWTYSSELKPYKNLMHPGFTDSSIASSAKEFSIIRNL